jgi:hypothetical protein
MQLTSSRFKKNWNFYCASPVAQYRSPHQRNCVEAAQGEEADEGVGVA